MRIQSALCVALLVPLAAAAKQTPRYDIALTPPGFEASEYSEEGRVAAVSRVPLSLYGVGATLLPGTPEAMARQFLSQYAAVLQLRDATLNDLSVVAVRSSKSGHNVHFEQRAAGVPVYGSRMVIHIGPQNQVSFVTSGYQPAAQLDSAQPLLGAGQARAALIERLQARLPFRFDDTQLVAVQNAGNTRLAWQVRLSPARPIGSWEALVDANSGELFVLWDRAAYAKASIFDPDPLSSSGTQYGASIDDRNDANFEAIAREVFTVDLGEVFESDGVYVLSNQWAEITDHEAPSNGFFEQSSPDFLFTREQDGFEAVNTFWHLQNSMRYINETLGIALRPIQYEGGVQFDPQGLDGDDNSHYDSGSGQLAFGEGCVDDDEDADVVLHELGHGLHDWVTHGGLSNIVDGLSEGFGDYWAQSYSRSLGQWGTSNPEYHWVFNWDGHNECWGGRVTNIALPYPTSVQPYPAVHSGGQHWSTCLMRIYDQIGREKTDTITLEGLAMTGMLSSQNDAANAVYQAATDLGLPAGELDSISSTFEGCGYMMSLPAAPATAADVVSTATSTLKPAARFGGALTLSLLLGLAGVASLRRRQ